MSKVDKILSFTIILMVVYLLGLMTMVYVGGTTVVNPPVYDAPNIRVRPDIYQDDTQWLQGKPVRIESI